MTESLSSEMGKLKKGYAPPGRKRMPIIDVFPEPMIM